MPVLEHEDAIKQYYEEVKDKYPEMDHAEFELVCRAPFLYIKRCIMSTTVAYNIRVKFLGVFNLYTKRVRESMTINERAFKKKIITEEEYTNRKDYLERLENYIANDKKNKESYKTGKDAEITE